MSDLFGIARAGTAGLADLAQLLVHASSHLNSRRISPRGVPACAQRAWLKRPGASGPSKLLRRGLLNR
jgi:hypothetical protein